MGEPRRSSLFRKGAVSRKRREEGMARRFKEIVGGKVVSFWTEFRGK